MEQSDLTKRFIEVIKYIRENIKNGDKLENNASIAKKINVSPSYITEAEKGRTNVKIQKIQGLCIAFPVSRSWLEYGYGEMIIPNSLEIEAKDIQFNVPIEVLQKTLDNAAKRTIQTQLINQGYPQMLDSEATQIIMGGIMLVPLVNQYAHAGYMTGYSDAEYIDTLPKIPWIVDHEYKGNYISFEVRGDSMDDGLKHSYEQGDVLLCREIYPQYWKCKLHINTWDAFVIVHKTDGIVVKQIINHDVENGIITCHSFNPIYDDFQIDLREVAQLFNVVKQQKNK